MNFRNVPAPPSPKTGAQFGRQRNPSPSSRPALETCTSQSTGVRLLDTGHQQRGGLQGVQGGAFAAGAPLGPPSPLGESAPTPGHVLPVRSHTGLTTGLAWSGRPQGKGAWQERALGLGATTQVSDLPLLRCGQVSNPLSFNVLSELGSILTCVISGCCDGKGSVGLRKCPAHESSPAVALRGCVDARQSDPQGHARGQHSWVDAAAVIGRDAAVTQNRGMLVICADGPEMQCSVLSGADAVLMCRCSAEWCCF